MIRQGEPPGSERDDIRQIIARARDRLSDQSVSAGSKGLLGVILAVLKRAHDYDELERQVKLLIRDFEAGRATLRWVLREAERAEAARSVRERFGEVWWKRRHREVTEAFAKGPAEGRHRWLETYAEALTAARFDVCLQMTLDDWRTPEGVEVLRTGAAALQAERYRDAAESVEMLARESERFTSVADRVALLVFLGRIHLYELSNLTAARAWVTFASELAPEDGRVAAALGECQRVGGELDQAREQFARAIQLATDLPDGYIGAAMVCEDQQGWHRALGFYDDAIDAAGETARFGQLLAPAPAGLSWQLALRLKEEHPSRALEEINRALRLGVRWSNSYPDRRALRDRAEILDRLGELQRAADSYFEAGQKYSWLGKLSTARPLLERACELNPGHTLAHWQLSEVLRVLSYTATAPFLDGKLVEQSKSHWEAGATLRHPGASEAWVYLGRALLNEQLWALTKDPDVFWESLKFLECALLLDQDYATAWAYLGNYHRQLNNIQNALHATERALSIDPADIAGLESRSMALAQVGRYAEAEQLIDQRLKQAEEWWVIALKAYVQLRTGRADEALEFAQRAVANVPDDVWFRSVRGSCRRRLGQRDQAAEDYRWIWEHRDTTQRTLGQPQIVAWAGLMLGEFDEAAAILQTALDEHALAAEELWMGLGEVRLARGDQARDDITESLRAFERGIALIRTAGQLDDLLGLELDELGDILAGRLHPGPAQGGLARVRELVTQAHDRLSHSVVTPDDELRANAGVAAPDSSMWLAAQAGMARRAGEAGQWDAALDAYLTLSPRSFPEAGVGLTRAIRQLQKEADRLVISGKIDDARDRYVRLLGLAREQLGTSAELTVGLALRACFAALAQSDDEAAGQHLGQIISDPVARDRVGGFDGLAKSFLRSPMHYWDLVDGLRRVQRKYPGQSMERAVLQLMAQLNLSRLYGLAAGEVSAFPMATPLALKIGSGLKRTDPDGEEALRRDLAYLQRRVADDTGIRVPGVRVLAAHGPGEYAILIDGTPVTSGSVPVDKCFDTSEQADRPIGDHWERDPLSGAWGRWVNEPEQRAAGPGQWSPLAFVVRAVEAVVRRSLPRFIGSDDVQAWLDSSPGDISDLARVVLPDRSARVLLSRVLQVLAREGVPLTASAVVLKTMHRARPGAGVLDLAADVRRQLREALPGNTPGTWRVNVPEPIEEALAAGLLTENGSVSWQRPRHEAAQLLDRLREIYQDAPPGTKTALVVRSSVVRPFVWRLVSTDFPCPSVLSKEELVEPDGKPGPTAVVA